MTPKVKDSAEEIAAAAAQAEAGKAVQAKAEADAEARAAVEREAVDKAVEAKSKADADAEAATQAAEQAAENRSGKFVVTVDLLVVKTGASRRSTQRIRRNRVVILDPKFVDIEGLITKKAITPYTGPGMKAPARTTPRMLAKAAGAETDEVLARYEEQQKATLADAAAV